LRGFSLACDICRYLFAGLLLPCLLFCSLLLRCKISRLYLARFYVGENLFFRLLRVKNTACKFVLSCFSWVLIFLWIGALPGIAPGKGLKQAQRV
jgi:hypothetical protein